MPRPTIRSPKVERAVLDRIAAGEPLAAIGRDDKMPHPSTWRTWCDADENLAIAYARARDDGFDAIAAQCFEIADQTEHDTHKGRDGAEIPNTEWIQRSKLRVETRLKLLAKWDPKRYGELVKVGNADGSNLDLASALAAGNARVNGND